MKRSEMFENFAKCVKMVEDSGSTNIHVRKMVRIDGYEASFIPTFDSITVEYDFAVGIIEDTPIFIGDTVYHERNGECTITNVTSYSGSEYYYYSGKGAPSNTCNSQLSAFSLKDKNSIKLEDVKAFAIFVYDTSEVMVTPADYNSNGQRFTLSGLNGSFGKTYSTSPKSQKEMYEYLSTPNWNGKACAKTNKRFGLIED